MKMLKKWMRGANRPGNTERYYRRNEGTQYCDNYTMLGSILGGYCGMLRFDSRKK